MQSKDYQHLRNCPFCGRSDSFSMNEIEVHNPLGIDSELYNAKCRHCGIQTEDFKTEDELIRFWNSRPIEDKKDKEIAELKKELSDNADEGYVGFLLGIEQMRKKLAEKDKEIERLKKEVNK